MLSGAPTVSASIVTLGVMLLGGITYKLLQTSRNFPDRYNSEYDEVRDHYWSKFSGELSNLIARAVRAQDPDQVEIELTSDGGQQAAKGTVDQKEPDSLALDATNFVEDLDRPELKDMEEALRKYDKLDEERVNARDRYTEAWPRFGAGSILTIFLAGPIAVFDQNITILLIESFIGIIAIALLFWGSYRFVRGRRSEREIDRLIEDYQRH